MSGFSFKDFISDYGSRAARAIGTGFLGLGGTDTDKYKFGAYGSNEKYTPSVAKGRDEYLRFGERYNPNKNSRFKFLNDIGDAAKPYIDTAKKYYGYAEKYALKPIKKAYDWLPDSIQKDLMLSLKDGKGLDSDYYNSLKELSKRRGARIDTSGSGSGRAFTAGRAGGGGPVGRAQQAYGENSLAFRLMEKAAGSGRINNQIAKNFNSPRGRQTIGLSNIGNIRPFRGKTKLT